MVLCSALRPAQHFAAIAGWMSQSDWELHMATDNFVRAEARVGPMLIGTAFISGREEELWLCGLPGGIMNGNNQRSSSTILCGQTLFQVCGSPGKAPSYAWCLCILTMRIWWTGPVLKEASQASLLPTQQHSRHPLRSGETPAYVSQRIIPRLRARLLPASFYWNNQLLVLPASHRQDHSNDSRGTSYSRSSSRNCIQDLWHD